MAAFDHGPLSKYNSLTDRHLQSYFSNDRMRHHLVKNGLITKTGEVVPDAVYRVRMARREHRRRVRDLIAQAIIHKALEMERSRQIDIRKKIEEIAKIELVRRVREDRIRIGDEDCISYFNPGNMDIVQRTEMDKNRTQSEIDEHHLPTSVEEKSRLRLRKLLPAEEIESKHLSQLDSLTLGEYSKILQKQDRLRINKLPYLGLGDGINRRHCKLSRPKKCKKRSESQKDEVIQSARSNQSKLQSLTKLSILFHSPCPNRSYDVMVEQQPSGGSTVVLFRDTLTANSVFPIVSHRHKGFPFSLTFYIDNVKDSRISTCCECKHKVGKRIGGPNGHFSLFSVDGAYPCYRCLTEQDMIKETKKNQRKDTKSNEPGTNERGSISVDNTHSPYSDNEFQSSSSSSEKSSDSENEEIKIEDKNQVNDSPRSSSSSSSGSSRLSIEKNAKNNEKVFIEIKQDKIESPNKTTNNSEPTLDAKKHNSVAENCNNNAIETGGRQSNNSQTDEFPSKSSVIKKILIVPKKEKTVDNQNEMKDTINDTETSKNTISDRRRSSTDQKPMGKHAQYKATHGIHVLLDKHKEKEKQEKENKKKKRNFNEKQKESLIAAIKSVERFKEASNKDKDQNANKNVKNKDNLTLMTSNKSISDSRSHPSSEQSLLKNQEENNIKLIEEKSIHPSDKLSKSSEDSNMEDSSSDDEKPTKVNDENIETESKNHIILSPQAIESSLQAKNDGDHTKEIKPSTSDKRQLQPLAKDEDSESNFSLDSNDIEEGENKPNNPMKNEYKKIPESSNSDDESSSSTESNEKPAKFNNFQMKTPVSDDREDLKLSLPNDDNESSKPSTSDRLDNLDNIRSESNKPDIDTIKQDDKDNSSSASASESEFESGSESEIDDENKNFITVENQMDEAENILMNTSPADGISVSVENDDINFKRAKEICQSINGVKIESLKIRNCELPNYVFNFISDQLEKHPELKTIELSGCEIEISLLNLLAKSLKVWPNLEGIILSDNQFTDYSLQNLIDMIKFLYDNVGNPEGMKQQLKVFDLSNCSIQENDLTQLIDMIAKNTRLETFILDGTVVSPEMFKEICKALTKNDHLNDMSVKNCQISQSMLDELDDEFEDIKIRLKI